MNSKLSQIKESVTIHIADMARKIERGGERVIKLQTGDPDFSTPDIIVEAACAALKAGHTHYADSRGLPDLREAIVHKLKQENDLDYDPISEIIVTHGGIHAIFISINTLIEKGDEVIIIDPCWMPYVSSTFIAGGKPIRISSDLQNGLQLRIEQIEACLSERTKLLILNSPCNPTGKVLNIKEMEQIAGLAERYNLYVISDEVYEKLIYDDNQHVSFASLPGMKERTITVNSFSKTYAMTGWRIGYLAAKKNLVDQILKLSQYTITNVAPFVQKAAVVAMSHPEVEQFVSAMKEQYDRRRRRAIEELQAVEGVRVIVPQGAFYLMIDISKFSRDSAQFANNFLKEKYVGVIPGVSFGQCAEGFIRMTFAASEDQIMDGINRLGHMLRTFRQ